MTTPRRISPSGVPPPTPPAASSPSLAVPQIPPRSSPTPSPSLAAGPSSASPLCGSPRRSPAFLSSSPSGGPSGLTRSRVSDPALPSTSSFSSDAPSPSATPSASPLPPPLSDAQKAEVIRKHLLTSNEQHRLASDQALQSGFSLPKASFSLASGFPQELGRGQETSEEYPTPYHLEGGDVVAGVYKWAAQQAEASSGVFGSPGAGAGGVYGSVGGGTATPAMRRSKSMDTLAAGEGLTSRRTSHAAQGGATADRAAFRAGLEDALPEDPGAAVEFSREEMLQPGGFRRDFVFRRLGGASPSPGGAGTPGGVTSEASSDVNASGVSIAVPNGPGRGQRPTRSFIDFLSLYGHFGGEDLEEIEEEDEEESEEDEEALVGSIPPYAGGGGAGGVGGGTERTPLLRNRSTFREGSRSKRMSKVGEGQGKKEQGDATVTQAVMMLLKSFVGTGVLFLGKAFFNGGILFSGIVLCFIAMISLYSFLLLVETRLVINGSFGDIGGQLYGKYMRWAVLSSIVLSQIGFVSAYLIFVAENLQAFFTAVTNCRHVISIPYLIAAQLVIFLPLAMIRNIQKLSGTALVADVFIILGLVYIFSSEIGVLAEHGIARVELFNREKFPLLIGTAVFAFEGIGLIIPVQEAMKDPHKLPKVLTGVMVGVMLLFAGAGTLAYLTYGDKIQTVVFVNLPQSDRFVNASQFLYSLAILLSTPLQLFPAVRIMEQGLFGSAKSGKWSRKVKWEKNLFRAATVAACAVISWLGASDLDKFVSFIGSVACVPLGLIFPPMLHYKACARTRRQKGIDIGLMIFGVLCALYTGYQTVSMILAPAPPGLTHASVQGCPPRS